MKKRKEKEKGRRESKRKKQRGAYFGVENSNIETDIEDNEFDETFGVHQKSNCHTLSPGVFRKFGSNGGSNNLAKASRKCDEEEKSP